MKRLRVAGLAVGMAVGGIGVTLAGEQFGSAWLTDWAGPSLTLTGAALWVLVRFRGRTP
jgi:hypothetical protein